LIRAAASAGSAVNPTPERPAGIDPANDDEGRPSDRGGSLMDADG
jgi:hypothetical protein